MTQRFLKTSFVALLASLPALLPAQSEISGKEEERLEALARSEGEWKAPKGKLSVSFRILNSGGKVDFTNLGTVPTTTSIVPASAGLVQRVYSNGTVRVDQLRTTEKDADGKQTSTPGGRYDVFSTQTVNDTDANGNVTGTHDVTYHVGDLVSYTPGLTREWQASTFAQVTDTPGYVAFSIYDVTSEGASASHKQGATGGVEFSVSRDIGRSAHHMQWGVVAGIALNDINSKASGTVNSTLHTYTDYYSTNGRTFVDETQLTNPSYTLLPDGNGGFVIGGFETTVPLNGVPDATRSTNVSTVGGASVAGRWQVKGAYFMFKLGPSVRAQLGEHLGLTASLGLAGAYAGTRYSAYEAYTVAALPGVTLDTTESSSTAKFLKGYFADLNLEWSANETMGLFGGVTAQQLSDYTQTLGGRTAKVDLGSAVGLRGGVSIRF
jgi:hypothetical protein